MNNMFQIILKDNQKNHLNQIERIVGSFPGYIDASPTGSGKTYVTMYLAKKMNLPLYIICPTDVESNWRDLCTRFGVNIIDVITYQSFASRKGKQPSHGLLERTDSVINGKEVTNFYATQKLSALLWSGTFFIMDEAQKLKNDSAQTAACIELTNSVFSAGFSSRFALLSGSLFDKEEHICQILKLLCLLNRNFSMKNGDAKMLDDFTKKIAFYCGPQIIQNQPANLKNMSSSSIQNYFYTLFLTEIKNKFSSSMNNPHCNHTQSYRNSFYRSNAANAEALKEEVDRFAEKTNLQGAAAKSRAIDGTSFVHYLMRIEQLKLEIFARIANKILEENPKSKLVICLNYIESMVELADMMKEYSPVIFNGTVKPIVRETIISNFQNSDNHRFIIMNTALSAGFNLHDTVGERPRYMLISPDYKVINIHQAIGRINRTGMMSGTNVEIIYSLSAPKEFEIIQALVDKSSILSSVHDLQVRSGVVFPGDFPFFKEEVSK